ncbi:MAG TPA: cupin domain-containing protein [Cyclobacteriaceae bacterium]|jgi:quercetin dioxygenase-like cupin family protein
MGNDSSLPTLYRTTGFEKRQEMEKSRIISKGQAKVYDALGPSVGFLVSPTEVNAPYCIMEGRIPAGFSVPLHHHPDDESFYIISGKVKVWREDAGWSTLEKGDFVHVPAGMKHAWKNDAKEPNVGVIVTTPRLGSFFLEAGRPIEPGREQSPPTPEDFKRFTEVAARYNHWVGSPGENASIGIAIDIP